MALMSDTCFFVMAMTIMSSVCFIDSNC